MGTCGSSFSESPPSGSIPLFYAQPLGLDPRSGAILRFKPLKSSPEMKPRIEALRVAGLSRKQMNKSGDVPAGTSPSSKLARHRTTANPSNIGAARSYCAHGFTETGQHLPMDRDPSIVQIELAYPLAG